MSTFKCVRVSILDAFVCEFLHDFIFLAVRTFFPLANSRMTKYGTKGCHFPKSNCFHCKTMYLIALRNVFLNIWIILLVL